MYSPYGSYFPQNNMRSPVPQVQPSLGISQAQADPFKVIPVASPEEAAAVPTDFMGATLLLPDFAHKAVYTKTFNPNTGLPIFLTFKLEESSQATAQTEPAPYDAKSEIEKLAAELEEINEKLSAIQPETPQEAKKK